VKTTTNPKLLIKNLSSDGKTTFSLVLCVGDEPLRLIHGDTTEGKTIGKPYTDLAKAKRAYFDLIRVGTEDDIRAAALKQYGRTTGNLDASRATLNSVSKFRATDYSPTAALKKKHRSPAIWTFHVRDKHGNWTPATSAYHRAMSKEVLTSYIMPLNGHKPRWTDHAELKRRPSQVEHETYVIDAIALAYYRDVIQSFGEGQTNLQQVFSEDAALLGGRAKRLDKLVFKDAGRKRASMMAYFDGITKEIAFRRLTFVTMQDMLDVTASVWYKMDRTPKMQNSWRYSAYVFPDGHLARMNKLIWQEVEAATATVENIF
jgi:hypothetical protein